MSDDTIRWQTIARDSIPDVLFGDQHGARRRAGFFTEPYNLKNSNVAVGFVGSRTRAQYNPPVLMILGDESAVETLSWLRVYAPETWPLSQYARVVSSLDWSIFHGGKKSRRDLREDIWSSVILGEALAQGETEVELPSLPLSRASACFSMAIARTICIHGTDEASKLCTDRLRSVESDRRFVRRPVAVNDLMPVWALAAGQFGEPMSPQNTASMVLEAASKFMSNSTRAVDFPSHLKLKDIPGLLSDSIEQRVLGFQQLSAKLTSTERHGLDWFPSVLLAAAAFLVGRSTSHQFLLHRVSKQFPLALAWYGLIAGLAGPAAWDADWSRASKGIERQLRYRFDWSESAGFDICWLEYAWIANAFEGPDAFNSLPKLLPRVVSIEAVPGATCQFRLVAGASAETDTRPNRDNARANELQAALSQFVVLANRARHLLHDANVPAQQALALENQDIAGTRELKNKKTKGRADRY